MEKCKECGKELIFDEVGIDGFCMDCYEDILYCENCGKEMSIEETFKEVYGEIYCVECVKNLHG